MYQNLRHLVVIQGVVTSKRPFALLQKSGIRYTSFPTNQYLTFVLVAGIVAMEAITCQLEKAANVGLAVGRTCHGC
jgi:hypothetical protein